jgi:hypothetical protein
VPSPRWRATERIALHAQRRTHLGLLLSGREALYDMLGVMTSVGGVGGVFGCFIDGRSSRTMVRFAVSMMIFSSSSSYANDSQPIWVCCCLGREALNDILGGMATEGGVGGGIGVFVYSIQLNKRDEPSINKLGGVLCVAQDRKVICKHDYSGNSRSLVFIMNHHQHQIRL